MKKSFLLLSSMLVLANVGVLNAQESSESSLSVEMSESVSTDESTSESVDESSEAVGESGSENEDKKDPFDPASYETVFEADTYKIGTDMPAGEYKLFALEEYASYDLTGDARGEEYIAYNSIETFAYVVVEDGQFLEISEAFAVPVEDVDPVEPVDGKFGPGVYRIGVDIEPGEYKVTSIGEYASYDIATDANFIEYVDYGSIEKSNYVEVRDGEYLELVEAELIVE